MLSTRSKWFRTLEFCLREDAAIIQPSLKSHRLEPLEECHVCGARWGMGGGTPADEGAGSQWGCQTQKKASSKHGQKR